MEHLRKCKTICEATAGADIYDCIAEAVVLAMTADVPVEFIHNERIYTADPKAIRSGVKAALAAGGE